MNRFYSEGCRPLWRWALVSSVCWTVLDHSTNVMHVALSLFVISSSNFHDNCPSPQIIIIKLISYPFKPYSALLVTSYCTLRRKNSLCALARRFCWRRTCVQGWDRVLCTWQLLGLAVKSHGWHRVGQFPPCCMNRRRKRYSHLRGVWQGRLHAWTLSGYLPNENADYCMFINEWAWLRSWVCLLWLKVHLGSVLESELRQKWRYGALKACIC